jgi:hypothetical protein
MYLCGRSRVYLHIIPAKTAALSEFFGRFGLDISGGAISNLG